MSTIGDNDNTGYVYEGGELDGQPVRLDASRRPPSARGSTARPDGLYFLDRVRKRYVWQLNTVHGFRIEVSP